MMSDTTKKKNNAWSPELPDAAFSETRTAASSWFYALMYEPEQDLTQLLPLISEVYPQSKISEVSEIVHHQGAFADLTDELIERAVGIAHYDGYEILPWREAVMRTLAIDFLSCLKTPSAQLSEDAIVRVTAQLGENLRGTTKNACQLLSGLRTRLRKTMRALVLSALYFKQYRGLLTEEEIEDDLMSVVQKTADTEFIPDEFPFGDYLDDEGKIDILGRFVIKQAVRMAMAIVPMIAQLDEWIQASSRNWRTTRMASIDLNILRMGCYELMVEKTSSPRSLINEAVEMAKQFSAEQSKKFVNGILQQICTDNQIDL